VPDSSRASCFLPRWLYPLVLELAIKGKKEKEKKEKGEAIRGSTCRHSSVCVCMCLRFGWDQKSQKREGGGKGGEGIHDSIPFYPREGRLETKGGVEKKGGEEE